MFSKLVWVAALAAAAVGAGAAALPAAAGTTPAPHPTISSPGHAHVPWVSATCASGSIGVATNDFWQVTLPATATACGTQDPAAAFELVSFRTDWTDAVAGAGSLVKYHADDPTTAQVGFQGTFQVPSRLFGVCLMGSLDQRFDCVKIDVSDDGVLTETHIPIDDPLVTKPMRYNDDPVMTRPGTWCVNCVSTPW